MLKIQRLDAVIDKADSEKKGSVIAVEEKFGWGALRAGGKGNPDEIDGSPGLAYGHSQRVSSGEIKIYYYLNRQLGQIIAFSA